MRIDKVKLILLSFLIAAMVSNVVFVSAEFENESKNDVTAGENEENIVREDNEQYREVKDPLSAMKLVAQNEFLQLFFNQKTTEIAVKDRKTGDVWYSNPPDREEDTLAAGINKDLLSAQLKITYHTPTAKEVTLNNFSDSIEHDQFEVVEIENGIKIIYTIGKAKRFFIIPQRLTQKRFEEILEMLEEEQQTALKRRYSHISLSKVRSEKTRKELLEKYPLLEETDIYELKQGANESVLAEIEKIFMSIGYTIDDLNKDHIEAQLPPIEEEAQLEIFTVPLEYRLEGNNLVVSIPLQEIQHDKSYPITEIEVLEFFGCGNKDEQGYIFVPDGSGALIYLNNGKVKSQPYISPVYGYDKSIRREEIFERANKVNLPVFGIKRDNKALFGIIEEGSSFATIKADISGRVNSYNTVSVKFTLLPNDVINLHQMTGNNLLRVYQPKMYEGNFRIRYAFLSGQEADYVGMAKYYRNYLIERGILKKLPEDEKGISFYLELIGAVDKIKPVWGIPRRVIEPLTTFAQAKEIVQELIDKGVEDIKLKYTGWFNGGVKHSFPGSIRVQRELGGKKGFENLVDFLKKNDMELYPDVCFMYVYKTNLFDGFIVSRDAARFLDREVAVAYEFNPATNVRDTVVEPYYIVNPNSLERIINSFARSYQKLNVDGVALRYMGTDLNSNFREKSLADREKAKEIVSSQLEKLSSKGYAIMAEGVNDYVLKYVSHVLNMPLEGSNYNICDESIPFYQIVVRGYISYAGEPINLASDYTHAVLKTVETGANVYFTWMYNDNAVLKESDYNYYYSINYKIWFEKAVELYNTLNSQLGDVQNREIIDHSKIADKVYKTTFEGGKSVIVNYRDTEVEVDGKVIQPYSYLVLEVDN